MARKGSFGRSGAGSLTRQQRRARERARRKAARRLAALSSGAALTLGAAFAAAPAQAATFTVTNLDDSGAGSLRQAVLDANAAAGPDVIDFQAGLTGGILLFSGQLAVTDSVDIQGPGAADLLISGNDGSRGFYLYNSSALLDVTISGLTVIQGSAGNGAGIINWNENLVLDDVTLTFNNATGDGGGLWSTGGSLTIRNSTLSGNTAGIDGGGVYVESGAPVLIENTRITGNGTADDGGGVYFYNPGSVTIDRSTISGNTASGQGGGVYLYAGGPLTIQSTTVSGNSAVDGGGIFLNGPAGSVVLENTTISGNTATDAGGGFNLYLPGEGGAVEIRHSTIAANTAAYGGGLFLYQYSVTLDHTIVADNTAGVDPDLCGGGDYDARFSLIEDPGAANINDLGGTIFNQDPQLGALAGNGGPTETHLPALASPAIDAGDPAFTPPPATDQRGTGFARVLGGQIDIGAVERAPAAFGTLQLSLGNYTVAENGGAATITVTRAGGSDGGVSVDYQTSNGSAGQPGDYLPAAGTLSWAEGDTAPKTFQVTIVDDPLVEGDETVNLTLSNVQGGASLGSPSTAVLTIVDDDLPALVEVPTLDDVGKLLFAGFTGLAALLLLRRKYHRRNAPS